MIVVPRSLGQRGEEVAAAYLISRGYKIIDTNWEFRGSDGKLVGELDIVAEHKEDIVFVEVKAGSTKESGYRPEIHMSGAKIGKLLKTARAWLSGNGKLGDGWRLDLVAVDFSKDPPSVRHYCHVNS